MIGLIQRVTQASVTVAGEQIAGINQGLLVLLGVERNDTSLQVQRLVDKLLNYRVFADNSGKMNLSLTDIEGELLLVPQFTLAADTHKGLRPSFTPAAPPDMGKQLFDELVKLTRQRYPHVQCGQFGADMQVSLNNDGPVTFWLQVKPD